MSSQGQMDLVLDRDVRDWVLVPLTISIFLMMLIRQYVTQVFLSSNPSGGVFNPKEFREKQIMARAGLLKQTCGYLSDSAFKARKAFFIAKDTGAFHKKPEQKSAQDQLMNNPDVMTDMMKKNLGGLVPQLAMGGFVSYFFSGFIMGRIPFPLSPSFRIMLQRGVDLPSLDVTYFTSLSYYILLLFGLNGTFRLIFRENTVDESQMMRQQMAMGGGGMGPMGAPDPAKAFEAERHALEMLDYKWKLDGIEQQAAAVMQQQLGGQPKHQTPRKSPRLKSA
ncbi:hypothetical protein WJX73_003798 [Symbiochloris irregularis]|uniref:ER membrane protein complex subunit 3 n=1 Tax=Symbiochloris irregularis TaxID=706552 RepID=A0AAW1Q2A3_9CHLO